MRGDVQAIFKETPHDKQVMMFSATLAKDIRAVCKKFMNKVRPCKEQSCQVDSTAVPVSCSLSTRSTVFQQPQLHCASTMPAIAVLATPVEHLCSEAGYKHCMVA